MTVVALAAATVLGVGYAPFAPGTFGAAAGLALWWFLPAGAATRLAAIAALFVLGAWSGTVAERHFRRTDPPPVVIDEAMGMLVTLAFVPVGVRGAFAGFFLFRVFDVLKPFPADRLERLPGGVGIMADDFMAAVYANLALRVLIALAHRVF